ncbi:MAG: septal ring lytic transglycosylase RlpA family protein [Halieaceae bacterium]|jgi:rare lipoprotein A|nr:septal ring lytic transglycosylase RlpA family protein [Halieaceae bacterium]
MNSTCPSQRWLARLTGGTLLVSLFFSVAGCSTTPDGTPPAALGYTESGLASFYAAKYQFRKTASGERFNQLAKTAAHRKLPFGTRLRVTNTDSGESVVVRVNDRGPFIDGRIIDLSRSAFAAIADTDLGVIHVTIEAVP